MSEHLSAQTLARYREKTLSPRELLIADDHLAACALCRENLIGADALQNAFTALRTDLQSLGKDAPEHLSYETLVAYVESTGYGASGGMDAIDREIVESHLEICASCEAQVRELRAFRTLMQNFPSENYAPRSRWEKWTATWASRRRLMSLTLGTALGATLLAIVVATHPWQHSVEASNSLTAQNGAPFSGDTAPSGTRPPASVLPDKGNTVPRETVEVTPNNKANSGQGVQGSGAKPGTEHHLLTPDSSKPQVAQNTNKTPGQKSGSPGGETPNPIPTSPHPPDKPVDALPQGNAPGKEEELPSAQSYVGRAGIRIANGKYDAAIADYKRATELDPTYAPAWEGLSWGQYLADKYDEALASNAKALELSKNTTPLHFRRGLIYATKGDGETAQTEYDKALGTATSSQKRTALKEAQDAQHAHPDVPALAKAVEMLEGAQSR